MVQEWKNKSIVEQFLFLTISNNTCGNAIKNSEIKCHEMHLQSRAKYLEHSKEIE